VGRKSRAWEMIPHSRLFVLQESFYRVWGYGMSLLVFILATVIVIGIFLSRIIICQFLGNFDRPLISVVSLLVLISFCHGITTLSVFALCKDSFGLFAPLYAKK
jgi:hypothetical protein